MPEQGLLRWHAERGLAEKVAHLLRCACGVMPYDGGEPAGGVGVDEEKLTIGTQDAFDLARACKSVLPMMEGEGAEYDVCRGVFVF